ncbi:MAG: pyridoxal phosphate-dependent class II aminotransferase [Candidatus Binataceae bacterium]|nr:pyridoxal phosphate-dependent class II aminotransferase [Candidatus Binataceae bacterium]
MKQASIAFDHASEAVGIDRVHGGAVRDGVIDFSISVNPLGPPAVALEAFHAAAAQIASYPSPYPRLLEQQIAAWLKLDPACVLAANGSTQLIYLIPRAIGLHRPLVVIPTFSEIANALIASGAQPSALRTSLAQGCAIDPDAIGAAIRVGTDAIFFGRPNSPTGTMLTLEAAADIARECAAHDAWCIVDEAFIDFVEDAESLTSIVNSNRRLIVLRSLTKVFAIPGLRLGYAVAHPEVIARLRNMIEPWSVSIVAERVASACLKAADDFIHSTRELIAIERAYLSDSLSGLAGITVAPAVANFFMIEVAAEKSVGAFGRHLLDRGIAIRDLSTLPGCGAGFYRIGIRQHPDNQRLMQAARQWRGA